MPSDFNHIDDFFRLKEEESTAVTNQQEKHWQQMKDLLVVPGPQTVKIRTINTRLYWQAAAGIIILAVFAFLLNQKASKPEVEVAENNRPAETQKIPDTVIREQLNEKTNYTVEKKSVNSNSFTITIKTKQHKEIDTRNSNSTLHSTSSINKHNNSLSDSIAKPLTSELVLVESKQKLDLLFQQLKKPAQEFYVNSKNDTTIQGNEGTKIFIPANSFQTTLGLTVSASVKLYVREFYNFADIIGNKLTTNSNGEILITAGMIYMDAKAGNEALQIKPGAELGLQMPTRKFDPQMQLFTAKKETTNSFNDASTDTSALMPDYINWIPAGQKQLRYASNKKMITVLNLSNNPQEVFYKHPFNPSKMKSVAKFVIPWYCSFSNAEIKEKLVKKFSRYYDEIRVKRESRPWSARTRKNAKLAEPRHFYDTKFVGDTVTMHIRTATRLKYISQQDSLEYEAKWKQELEDAIKRNRTYSDLIQSGNQYDFKISALGWINCDRFINYPKESITDLKFSKGEEFKDIYFHSILVFNKENVLLQGIESNNKIIFRRIPKGQSVSLVSIGVKDGKVITCIRNLIVGDSEITDLQFQETKPEELKEKLKQFGTVDRRG